MSAESSKSVDIPVKIPSAEHCSVCTLELAEAVERLPGVGSVAIDPATSTLHAEFDETQISAAELVTEVERLGHEVAAAISHAAFRVTGMDCPDCARTIDKSVGYLDGVLSAALNFASGTLFVEYDPAIDPRAAIVELVRKMDYGIEPLGDSAGRPVAEFRLAGLDCPDCASKLADRIGGLGGVAQATIDFNTARVKIGYDPALTDPATLARAITAAGYAVEVIAAPGGFVVAGTGPTWWERHRSDVATTASGVLIVAGWLVDRLFAHAEVLSAALLVLAILVGGSLIFRRAWQSFKARSFDMNVLMTVAVIGAVFIGEFLEGATVVFLFSVGGLLESRSLARTRRSIRELMDLAPPTAHVVSEGSEREVGLSEVAIGDTIRVRPGERVPVDGVIVAGSSAIDQSPITGESVPVDKTAGAEVFAGTLNTSGLLDIEVGAVAADSTLARVIYLVEEAQAQQAPFQRLVDRFTRYYTPAVVALAAVIAVVPPVLGLVLGADAVGFETAWDAWFYRALVLLVVACPCALVISTPVAIVSAITRATRDGILIKGGAFLEIAPRVRAMAFDKTGTLTAGRPEVTAVVPFDGGDAATLLDRAAALESYSTHPLARAVVRAAGESGERHTATDLAETPGRGVRGLIDGVDHAVGSVAYVDELVEIAEESRAQIERLETDGNTVLVVVHAGGKALGAIGVADEVRPEAAGALARLSSAGIRHLVMLTGDNPRTAAAIASRVGTTEVRSRLLPEDKTAAVRELKQRHGYVAMVGDGINDAPALAAADIGIAMGAAGSDTALETADVALMTDDVDALPHLFDLGRRTVANIRQNVWFSIAVKLAVLVAAVLGYAPLWLAVFADTGVALLVILNGLRLLRARPHRVSSVVS